MKMERDPSRRWAACLALLWGGCAVERILALVVPVGGVLLYLAITRQLFPAISGVASSDQRAADFSAHRGTLARSGNLRMPPT